MATGVAFGAIALSFSAFCWALSTHRSLQALRKTLRTAQARAQADIAARDAIIDGSRENVVAWGPDGQNPKAYGASETLLEACLSGPDALIVSQALDDLAATGTPFALHAQSREAGSLELRGRAVGQMVAVWFSEAEAAEASKKPDPRPLLDGLPVPVWIRDQDLNLTWANRSYAEAVGVADAAAAVAAQASIEKLERDLAASARREGCAASARCFSVVEGRRRAFNITESPLADGTVLGAAIDVTEAASAEAKLQQHLEAHADTLNRLATAVAIFDGRQQLSFYNRAFASLWGLPEEWLASKPSNGELLDRLREIRRLPERRDYQQWKRERLAAYANPDSFVPEELWHLPNGQTLRVIAQPDPQGGVIYLYEDITEKLALERSYNTLIGVQRATLDSLGEGVAVFGMDGRLKLHNTAFGTQWRFENVELAGSPHIKDVADICARRFGQSGTWDSLVSAVLAGPEHPSEWGHIQRQDQTVVTVGLCPLPDGATLVTFTDVTDRLRVETALRERNQALMAADELKSTFVQHASFLFRDPLNVVQGFADMLAGGHAGQLNERQRDYVDAIVSGSRRLSEITSDILDLAMIDSGSMVLEPAEVDVFDLLLRASESLRQHVSSRDIAFSFEVPPDIGRAVLDQRRIRQVVFNLLSNALRYTPRGGAIALGACAADDDLQIYVRDSGPGIPKDMQPRVFDRFEARGRSGNSAGAGLGLALVNSFIALHDGWVEIETAERRGTLVRCHVPRRLGTASKQPEQQVHAA